MYVEYNANPHRKRVGDCTVRALSKVLGQEWENTFIELCLQGFIMHDMPSSNNVWGAYLKHKGFKRSSVKTECPDCYTVRDFCEEYPRGTYVLALDKHVIAVKDGDYYDSWDSGDEVPLYYWQAEEDEAR